VSVDSSDDEWEEVESKVISLDCSAVNVLIQSLNPPADSAIKTSMTAPALKTSDKKAPYLQTFEPGQPPLVSFNQQVIDRVFGTSESNKLLTCLKAKGE
jgi:hypothetical protein